MKKILIRFWPIILIFVIWLVFASPYLVKGKVPFPSDYLAANFGPWNSYGNYVGGVKNGATPDVISQIYPWKKMVIDIWKTGSLPLWNPYNFSGTPLLANYQSAVLSPLNLIYFVLPFIDAWSIQIILAPLLAGIFMYLFTRSLKISEFGSLTASLAFMFCGFITSWLVYGTLPYAILFLPLSLFAIEKFILDKKRIYLLILALSIPFSFFSGHFQTSIYFILFILIYLIYESIVNKRLIIPLYISVLSGLLLSAPQLFPSIEFYFESVRSSIFIKTEVIPWGYLPTLIAPDFFGNPVTRNDWFGHYAEWNMYIGLIPLFLAFYSFSKKNKDTIFFGIAALVILLLSFQTPLLDLLIALKIPVLSTSAASRIVVLFSFCLSVLAGFGLDKVVKDVEEEKFKKIVPLFAIFFLIFAALWTIVITKSILPLDKASIAYSNLRLPSIIFACFVVVSLILFIIKNKKMRFIILGFLILLVSVDLIRFSLKWQPFEDRSLMYQNVPITNFLKNIKPEDRVFGSINQEGAMYYDFSIPEGYDPLYIGRYGELIGAAKDGEYHSPERSVVSLSKNGQYTGQIINLLGIKYIIHKISDGQAVWAFPYWTYPVDTFREVYKDDKYLVLENDKAQPRAFFVDKAKVVKNNREILRQLFRKELDLRKNAVLEENPGISEGNSSGSAIVKVYTPNKVEVATNNNKASVLVLSDPYYPGWRATINGKPAKIYRADYALRAVVVPKGKNTVTFSYNPKSFLYGLVLAGIGVIMLILLMFYSAMPPRKK
ncbi:MAG TPA: YfhO family protein [Patescibacteria group bacterium]|nr:YfhO family protein [Patescibacteria group bacterium]